LPDCDSSLSPFSWQTTEPQSPEFFELTDRVKGVAAADLPMKIRTNPEAKRKTMLVFQIHVEISLIFNGFFDRPDFLV
jgi:hypothetical protein